MGLAIVDNTMDPTDRAFRLRNAIMARRFYLPEDDIDAVGGSVGTNWTKILVGISCAFNISPAISDGESIGDGHFAFGIQSGNSASECFGLGGKHAIGVNIPTIGGASMTVKRDTTPPVVKDWFTNRCYRFRNGTVDNQSFPSNSQLNISADPNTSRSFYFFQAEKSGVNLNFTIGHLVNQVNLPQVDFGKDELITCIDTLTDITDLTTYTPSGKWGVSGVGWGDTVTEQATYGYLDSVFILWSGNSAKAQLDVFDIRYRVLT